MLHTVLRKIRPDLRVIDKCIWAKLVAAGQNLVETDLPSNTYPLPMVKAVAAVWLFTALRSDEVARLAVGCIEWPQTDIRDTDTGRILPSDAVCYLLVPINKTYGAFKKPVAPYVGKMVGEWESARPQQPQQLDGKSAEMVNYLFSVCGKRIGLYQQHFDSDALRESWFAAQRPSRANYKPPGASNDCDLHG